MVAIIENYASLVGQIITIDENAGSNENDEVTLQVDELKNHQDYPNLINLVSGNQLKVSMSPDIRKALGLKKGTKIKALVRAAVRNKYFFKTDSIQVIV